MKLDIVTPEKTLFSGEVDSVSLPGVVGMFTVLENHAPLYSILRPNGTITYSAKGHKESVVITGGFVEVLNNLVTACVETETGADKQNQRQEQEQKQKEQ